MQILVNRVIVAIDPNMSDFFYCVGRKLGSDTWSRFRYTRAERRYESGGGRRAYIARYNKRNFTLSLIAIIVVVVVIIVIIVVTVVIVVVIQL